MFRSITALQPCGHKATMKPHQQCKTQARLYIYIHTHTYFTQAALSVCPSWSRRMKLTALTTKTHVREIRPRHNHLSIHLWQISLLAALESSSCSSPTQTPPWVSPPNLSLTGNLFNKRNKTFAACWFPNDNPLSYKLHVCLYVKSTNASSYKTAIRFCSALDREE